MSYWPHAYRLVTPRLLVRCFDPADAPAFKRVMDRSYPHLAPWVDLPPPSESLEQVVAMLQHFRARFDLAEEFQFLMLTREPEEAAGVVAVTRCGHAAVDIGGWVALEHTGKRFAEEAIAAAMCLAFEAGAIQRIQLHCQPDNASVVSLAKRLGFTLEATLRKREWRRGQLLDQLIFILEPQDYRRPEIVPPGSVTAFDALGRPLLA